MRKASRAPRGIYRLTLHHNVFAHSSHPDMFLQLTLCDLHISVPTFRKKCTRTNSALRGPPTGPLLACPSHPPTAPVAHGERSSLCAASNDCAIPSGNQHEHVVSPSRQKLTTTGAACDVRQRYIVAISTPYLDQTGDQCCPCQLSYAQAQAHKALPTFGFRNLPGHGRLLPYAHR